MAVRVIPSQTRRRWPLIVAAVIVAILVLLSVLSGFFVDLLWFRQVAFSSVFWTILKTKIGLGVAFGAFFFAALFANLLIVRRMTPPFGLASAEQDPIDRYRVAFEPYVRWLLPLFCAVIALSVAVSASGQWRTFLLWRNSSGVTFHHIDPIFHRDAAFYVFDLPFLEFVQGWLYNTLVGITILVAIGHYLWGGIRPQSPGEKVTPQVKAHLSVLLGLVILTKAWGYQLGKFDLLTSARGVVQGASYTDVHAQLPALKLLVFIAIACAILFLVNIRFRGWALPVLGVGLLALASTVVGGIFPAAIQKFSVAPQELQREQIYIQRNITATRDAFGLGAIQTQQVNVASDLTPTDINQNTATVDNIRLWDPALLQTDFQQLQRIKQFYEFNDVDVDRYSLAGQSGPPQERMTMVSAREVNQNGIQNQTWQASHLVYTHGYGFAAAQVNTAQPDGSPLFVESNIPPQGAIPISQNGRRIYYGELSRVPFVVVHTGSRELDFQGSTSSEAQTHYTTYTGTGGIQIGGFFRRALFAWRYKDVNLLISSLIHPDSRILIYRNIQASIPKAAPFLKYDGDPYAAVVDRQLVWIQDAYTTTDRYPYSQESNLSTATGQPGLTGVANYIRNSVKVVVNAYSGHMTYYVTDQSDPIIQVWERAFPGLFTPVTSASPDLRAHFRYPENLFQVQAMQFARYHVTDPTVFYNRQDMWSIPIDPAFGANNPKLAGLMRPYYVLMRLPGQTTEHFELFIPFTPQGRENMVAWMAANSDPTGYGQMQTFEFPGGRNVLGPTQVFNQIQSTPQFSQQQTLLSQGTSQVLFGNFLVIPIDQSFLYVQPVFVQGSQTNGYPVLKLVVVVHGGNVTLGTTFQQALNASFAGALGNQPPQGGGGHHHAQGTVQQQIQKLLASALSHFQAANAALTAGDLATYQSELNLAQRDVAKANALAGTSGGSGSGAGSGATTPLPGGGSPLPTVGPTPSAGLVPASPAPPTPSP